MTDLERTAAVELDAQLADKTYRHGYQQGYLAAAQDAKAMKRTGILRAQEVANVLLAHGVAVLTPWRHAWPDSQFHPPRLEVPNWWRLRHQTFARDGRQCQNCGDLHGPFEIDHVKPVSEGGLPKIENLRVLCKTCNRRGPKVRA